MDKTLLYFILIVLIMSGCGVNNETPTSTNNINVPFKKSWEPEITQTSEDEKLNQLSREETNISQLPHVVKISFTPLEFEPLVPEVMKVSLEPIQSVPLGSIKNKSITLHVYDVTDQNSICSASYQTVSLIEFDGKIYQLPDCTSTILRKDDTEVENAAHRLQQLQINENQKQIIVAGVELAANGPGRTLYIVYDLNVNELLSFEDWGKSLVIDLDNSGDLEFVNQSPGLHMQSPNVTVYRWVNGKIEKGMDLKRVLEITNHSQNEVLLVSNDQNFIFEVNLLTDMETQTYESIRYKFESGNLRKIK
ncbi:hypothetical protein [Fredinandcohnia quinoae]|uniref:Lipoprotein n=1 Tax=Fredinandcohnia quinoae TaxID=2918902 RepID=A0AAW5E689_9BACI|nr:hypothetical protein [Fredinandcohnia sp. SECRCQ15]MCH1627868.1 hypothetical protein [Fredinandcohnia sp. SECRCQ15]